jgi:hypothetical protein
MQQIFVRCSMTGKYEGMDQVSRDFCALHNNREGTLRAKRKGFTFP